MAEYLSGRSGLEALHLISHGEEGTLLIGNDRISAEELSSIHADKLAAIGSALAEDGDFLIYGCNFASGESGEAAISLLAQLTHADVAASSDDTGHAELGGNWNLEKQSGTIEVDSLAPHSLERTTGPQ